VLREGIGGLSERLRASVRQSSLVKHALTKGEFRESEVADAFRPHLPRRWELSSGVVVNPLGEQSQQQDLSSRTGSSFLPLSLREESASTRSRL